MSANCLIVIDNHSPLNLAVEMFLAPRLSLRAIKSCAIDFQSLVDEIVSLKPQVVMIEDKTIQGDCNLMNKIFELNIDLKVVVVSSETNYIRIFRKDEVLIQNASEFLEIIQTR